MERGAGDVKWLKHPYNGVVRFALRDEKTMKVVANFYVEYDRDKMWVWQVKGCGNFEHQRRAQFEGCVAELLHPPWVEVELP